MSNPVLLRQQIERVQEQLADVNREGYRLTCELERLQMELAELDNIGRGIAEDICYTRRK